MEQYIISKKEAEENGVDLSMIEYCRQIRRVAQCNRVLLDESVHSNNKFNKHLFPYIEYCGLSPLDFVKQYLSNLQPYMLEHRKGQEKGKNFTCVLDTAYRISLYIKVDRTKNHEVIVSFHENINKRGFAPENNTIVNKKNIVPVFGEPTGARIVGSEREEIKLFIQRGMMVMPINVMAQACESNIYLVDRESIENPIIDRCNQYLRDLYMSNLDFDSLNNVEVFSVLQQISFTSYGNSIFSNLTLLIDNLDIQRGIASKKVADFALSTYIEHLYLTLDQAKELIDVMKEKYSFSSKKGMTIILDRIEDKLLNQADKTLKIVSPNDNNVVDDINNDVKVSTKRNKGR